MFSRIVLVAVCLIFPIQKVWADTWQNVGTTSNNMSFYILKDSNYLEGDIGHVTLKVNNQPRQYIAVDCKNNLLLQDQRSIPIKAGTIMETFYSHACKKKWYQFY